MELQSISTSIRQESTATGGQSPSSCVTKDASCQRARLTKAPLPGSTHINARLTSIALQLYRDFGPLTEYEINVLLNAVHDRLLTINDFEVPEY